MTGVGLTIRARLTLVYSGLFVAAGMVLLGVTYALLSQRFPARAEYNVSGSTAGGPLPSDISGNTLVNEIAENTWQDALSGLVTQGAIALVVVGVAATAFGWLLAGRMLQPLHRVTETARRIAEAPAADRGLH
jgi:hypothetical protein